MIRHGDSGLLFDFFDVDKAVDLASRVLDSPGDYETLRKQANNLIQSQYSLEVCLPQMLQLYQLAGTEDIPDFPQKNGIVPLD